MGDVERDVVAGLSPVEQAAFWRARFLLAEEAFLSVERGVAAARDAFAELAPKLRAD